MNKITKLALFAMVALVLAALIGWFFYLRGKSTEPLLLFIPEDIGQKIFDFLPFGGGDGGAPPSPPDDAPPNVTPPVFPGSGAPLTLPRVRQISLEPVAGAAVVASSTIRDATLVRFVERSTGHIFDATTDSPTVRRISNTTIPKLADALFVEDGDGVVVRWIEEDTGALRSFYGSIEEGRRGLAPEEATLSGVFLPDGIEQIAASPDGARIAFLVRDAGAARVFTARPDGSRRAEIFSSPFREWLLGWPAANALSLTSRAAAGVAGFGYSLTPTGALTRDLGRVAGLTALGSPDNARVVFSESSATRGFSLWVLTRASGARERLPFATLPEKCAWGGASRAILYCAVPESPPVPADYPDLWYRGIYAGNDTIWRMDFATGEASRVLDLSEEAGTPIDATRLFTDPEDRFVFFTNKNDLRLWSAGLMP